MAQSVSGTWSLYRGRGAGVNDETTFLGVDSASSCKLIQLSDLHLPALFGQSYRDRDVELQLLQVLEHVQDRHSDLDALLLSGDLVHHGHSDAYRRLAGYLDRFDKPWYWIAGNHDSLAEMQAVRQMPLTPLITKGWQILMLDSNAAADGQGGGSLADSELQRLEIQLQSAQLAGASLLLVLHHNPVSVQSQWQDQIMLGNAERFWQLLGAYEVPVTVLCGHVHQAWDVIQQGGRVLSCPSTAVQFVRAQSRLLIEIEGEAALPGYRWLKLSAVTEGPAAILDQPLVAGFETAVERVVCR